MVFSFGRRYLFTTTAIVVALCLAGTPSTKNDNPKTFEVTKNLEIFVNTYKELNTYYVDDLDPEKLLTTGIDAMLQSLDPYTDYIPQEEEDEFNFQVTGQYGGIGATIQKVGTQFIIVEAYEGTPAAKAGLKPGDVLLSINDRKMSSKDTENDTQSLKGASGTEVTLKIRRPNETTDRIFKLKREDIKIPGVPFYDFLDGDVAYIALETFTDKSANQVQAALKEMMAKKAPQGIILDLRGNGGGLLSEAVNLVNLFVDKNIEVVSTRGNVKEWDRTFRTLNKPVDTKTPLVVLIDENSASASEICAGAIQDLDRGVLLGQRSYGKGLVQNTQDLGYNARLKITTSKYYTPSGRCIQSYNYKAGSSTKIADSLKTAFKTSKGRTVYDGGGIEPDVKVEQEGYSQLLIALVEGYHIFNFATEYVNRNPQIAAPGAFKLSDSEYEQFAFFVRNQRVSYKTESEKALEELKVKIKDESYQTVIAEDLQELERRIAADKQKDIYKYKSQIIKMLEAEIVGRYYGSKGKYRHALLKDSDLDRALKILKNGKEYHEIVRN